MPDEVQEEQQQEEQPEVMPFDLDETVEMDDITQQEAAAGETQEEQQEADGQPRDEHGRFAAKQPGADAQPEGAEAPAEQPAEGEEGEPPVESSGEGFDLSAYPRFEYQADGKVHEVPGGAYEGSEGVLFTKEAMPWLKQQLATAYSSRNSWQQQLEAAKAEGARKLSEAEAKSAGADVIVAKMMELSKQDDEVAWEWFQDFKSNMPHLLLEAERAQHEAERSQYTQQLSEREEQERVAQLVPQLNQALDVMVEQFSGEFAGVDPKVMRQRLENMADRVFFEHPETGEIMVNTPWVRQEFEYHAQLIGATKTAEQVGKENEEAVTGKPATPPPVVPASGGQTPPAGSSMPKFKTKEELEAYLDSPAADQWALQQLQQK